MEGQLTDINYNTIILALIGLVNTAIISVGAYYMARVRANVKVTADNSEETKISAERAAKKTEEVAKTLKESDVHITRQLDKIEKTGEGTHTLVNSNMEIQLTLNAGNARFRADTTGRPEDIEAADKAEQLLKEHKEKQGFVDAGIETSGLSK